MPSKILALAMVALVVGMTVVADLGMAGRLFVVVERVPGGDTTIHFALYALLSFAVAGWALQSTWARTGSRWIGVVALLALAVALEELSQARIAARTFSLGDLSASLAGMLVGACAAALRPGARGIRPDR